jgi:ABC-type phosphate transport system substrate-binding protein
VLSGQVQRVARQLLSHAVATALGAVVITFNVNHIDRLRFDPETIAGIFLGKITNWKDRAILQSTSMPLSGSPRFHSVRR